jgi:hypothetical protein
MSKFFALPQEIRDSIYADVIPTSPVLVLPSSTAKLIPCPAIFRVSREFYHSSRNAFYRGSSIAFTPDRSALAELSRRPMRNQVSDIIILVSYWTQARSLEVCDLSDEAMTKIAKLFKYITSINLRLLLMHEIRGRGRLAASKHSFFYPSFLGNKAWNFMITKASLDLDIRTFRTDTSQHHRNSDSPIFHLRKLPCLSELDLRVRTSKSSHSTRASVHVNNVHTSSPAHRMFERVLHMQETFELQKYFSGLVSLLPNVKVFRLWRAVGNRHHVHFEPVYEEAVLKVFDGRACEPEMMGIDVR